MKRVILMVAAVAMFGTEGAAEACTCAPQTLEQSYAQSTDVAQVRVVWSLSFKSTTWYLAQVGRVFKGCLEPKSWAFLRTASSSAACGVELKNGKSYLVNGNGAGHMRGRPVVAIGLCGYNVPIGTLTPAQTSWLKHRLVCCGDACACADGSQPVNCLVDPCQVTDCPQGTCEANYCGGCNAEFYDATGAPLCTACKTDADCAWGQVCTSDGCLAGCQSDDDCPKDAWCSPSQGGGQVCKPFAQEGEYCGGFTPIWAQSKCAPGLICTDFPPFTDDAPGICRAQCKTNDQCQKDQYCAQDGICRDDGTCFHSNDHCNADGNDYTAILCIGKGWCTEKNTCEWKCGLGCQVDGVYYEAGQSFPAPDKCNTCTCQADGTIACTKKACLPICVYGGKEYVPGDTFPAGDGCNTCTCTDSGVAACTKMACPVMCEYGGQMYRVGDTFPAADGCNACTCTATGQVACTEKACPVGCEYGGQQFQPGATFPAGDGCNTCTCLEGGKVVCTLMACPAFCTVDGKQVPVGTVWGAGDGCNECTCESDGTIYCTKKPCVAGCEWNGAIYPLGTSFPAGDGCNTCTCTDSGQVICTLMPVPCAFCEYNGQKYAAGTSFPDMDGCNTCVCLADGSVTCTDQACAVCVYGGVEHTPGETWDAGDGCNTCTCTETGEVVCTVSFAPCPVCVVDGAQYKPGESWKAGDGCNTCQCTDTGEVVCTAAVCGCWYQDVFHESGTSFPAGDGCNTCSCMDSGMVACTLMACPPKGCDYNGQHYEPGQSFPADDGCNTCTCGDGGMVGCTKMACACDPDTEWWRQYMSTDPAQCPLLDYACPQNTTPFLNACGCGCQQSKDCPQWFNCMPGPGVPACNVDAIKAKCPYSGIAY